MAKVAIRAMLDAAVARRASDVHWTVGCVPLLRAGGRFVRIKEVDPLTEDDIRAALRDIEREFGLSRISEELDRRGGVDFGLQLPDGSRFRGIATREQNGAVGLVLRFLPNKIMTPEELGLPPIMIELATRPRGLVLVTGPTGSGKTTTQAALIDYLTRKDRDLHVITLENPIEYRLAHNTNMVRQREVPGDVPTFAEGLRQALRMDPDVIVVGEMRDRETIETALTAAETGHLVFGTLHTTSAARTITRVAGVFPDEQQNQIRAQLAEALLGLCCQVLMPHATEEGRAVVAFETMRMTDGIGNLIRKGDIFKIEEYMKGPGMQKLDDQLMDLAKARKISTATLRRMANDPKKVATTADFIDLGPPNGQSPPAAPAK